MSSAESFAKIPLLLAAIWANRVSYSSPTPFVAKKPDGKEGDVVGCVRVMRPVWMRQLSKVRAQSAASLYEGNLSGSIQTVTRIVILGEVLAILATHVPSLASTYALSVLELVPRSPAGHAAQSIRITPTFAAGWLFVMAGALVRLACYRTMGKHFTFEITIRKDHRLVTSGPYAVVRHPSYSAMAMVALGTIVAFLGSGSWLKECGVLGTPLGKVFAAAWVADLLYVPAVMVFLRVKTEDGLLRKEFGKEWDEWVKKTPYALVPGIY
ncbi:hypothetical protein TRAPUB_12840 [Trametes pubescens]|uniref:Protein-S-isoprenylcysteine O-methyltransferase n=1 Tax=Trametes pubescens TaxID=154538 RepID=A0A1M2VSU7_TRAPU|nr:hypothetical protein TRAPUB_12840 [Trametes pubescens]